ncbi:MAG: hypothetical protein VYD53_06345, partial [Pseudomonadota bacterium]|nr:hypothetical protein [Pseudomonadota bacterium]
YPLEPQQHESLPSKFSGIKPKPAKPKKAAKKHKSTEGKSEQPVKKTQRVRTMTGEDIGHMPMRKKATPPPQDEEE